MEEKPSDFEWVITEVFSMGILAMAGISPSSNRKATVWFLADTAGWRLPFAKPDRMSIIRGKVNGSPCESECRLEAGHGHQSSRRNWVAEIQAIQSNCIMVWLIDQMEAQPQTTKLLDFSTTGNRDSFDSWICGSQNSMNNERAKHHQTIAPDKRTI
jgi:hypothetical protein